MKKQLILWTFLFVCGILQSQTINFDFPYFGGQEYVFCLFKGEKTDTVARGALDKLGKSAIVIPAVYKDFVGLARWSLLNGGGLEIVLNKEKNFSVHCSAAEPNENNILYINTPENEFMYGQYLRQSAVINKAVACNSVLQQYTAKDSVYRFIDAEKQRLEREFTEIQTGIRQSPLYGARIREYSDFLTYTGSCMSLNEKEILAERRNFVLERLNLQQLYHSGFWKGLIEAHIASISENDSLLLADTHTLLSRAAGNKEMKDDLLHILILQYHKYGKENLLIELGIEDLVSPGRLAPMLRLTNKYIRPVNSLVIFYESGCNACENELLQLRGNYPLLQEKGIEVISVSADKEEDTFNSNATLFPWDEKYCDYKGFSGDNFRNYEVKGAPAIFLTDREGKIVGRYTGVAEMLIRLFTSVGD